mgnify:CR=1 FL=1
MKFAVFGATSGTGRAFCSEALTSGHTIVALARDPSKLTLETGAVQVLRGDVLDRGAVEAAELRRAESGGERGAAHAGQRVEAHNHVTPAHVEVVGECADGVQALSAIQQHAPDLVFLDVQMPGLDGMGVIRRLREKGIPLPHFVMATAYDQYAVEAFRLEALDYLLKPVEKERLEIAVDRARRIVAEKAKAQPAEAPIPASQKSPLQRSKLLVRSAQRNFIIDAHST